jgi:hypothetical protein
MERKRTEAAGWVPALLRRALDEEKGAAVLSFKEALARIGDIERDIGPPSPTSPVREVLRRYLVQLRAAVEDLLARALRDDPGREEILAGEVLPLSEGLEGLCRSLAAEESARGIETAEEA